MDSKHKALLMHHRPFLARNIVWSSPLVDQLKAQGLLTDFMLKDIEACTSREDKVKKFIDVLPLKGMHSFNKFLDILQTSGHVFIADFLREDEEFQKLFDVQDMYKQLPFVRRAFNETERKQIETYMSERIEAQVLKLLWKRDTREKDKALEAKQLQIEQAYEYEEQFKVKADTIAKLEQEVHAALDDKTELKAKLAALSAAHREMEKKHKETLAIQMKYNLANDNAVQRANERIAMLESVLRAVKTKLDNALKLYKEKNEQVSGSDVEDDKKEMQKAQGEYFFMSEDVDLFVRKFKSLTEVKKLYDKLLEERDYILIHFGWDITQNNKKAAGVKFDQNQEPSLIDAYKSFAVRNEENIQQMRSEIEKYGGMLQENKTKLDDITKEKEDRSKKFALGTSTWQSAIMNVMRKQLQDVKTDMRKKESLMSMQEEEMNKLKNKISELESQPAAKEQASSGNARDATDGLASALSTDSLDRINVETPKPIRGRNLPPLKSSYQNNHHKPSASGNMSPRQSLVKPTRPAPAVMARHLLPEQTGNMVTYPMGPITTQMNPQTRNLGMKPPQMGSVLGDLKAMNKHHNKTFHDEGRSGLRRSNNNLTIK
ncbi:myosin-9 [Aplysia californica]|uniref:Myosin-9 n=1 Tax=Aplysia californica TaxID=6500 RepID=A0ABM0K2T5_APLCA|nr:myosin-9 [Aplysia californica]